MWKEGINRFISERLNTKLEKLADDDPRRAECVAQHAPQAWLADAARRVQQIQAVTHSLKPIHPDARGTNLYVEPRTLPPLAELGSHALGERFVGDVVGNAAALDVYKLLKLEVNGRSLLAALLAQDADALAALHSDPPQAQALRDAFVSLTQPRGGGPSSHTLAKQLYWLTGSDACDDTHYALLAPLYATSLAHAVHGEIQEHRFGATNKAARQARHERKHYDGVHYEYPDLAQQKLGGTKPQNISQLNSERGGVNYLLSSLPPVWRDGGLRLPVQAKTVFDRLFGVRPEVQRRLTELRKFLAADPRSNIQTRERREALVDSLIDELVIFAADYQQTLPAGWTQDEKFAQLDKYQQLWLDPMRAAEEDFEPFMPKPNSVEQLTFYEAWRWMDWPAEIGKAFARWLNQSLGKSFGDVEARVWSKELLTDEDGFKPQLRDNRDKLEDAPHYIPIRKTHAELVALREEKP